MHNNPEKMEELKKLLRVIPEELVDNVVSTYIRAHSVETGHIKPSPETEKKLALNEQRFNSLEKTLGDIVNEIKSAKKWVMYTLYAGISFFFIGGWVISNWKTSVDYHLSVIDKELLELAKND